MPQLGVILLGGRFIILIPTQHQQQNAARPTDVHANQKHAYHAQSIHTVKVESIKIPTCLNVKVVQWKSQLQMVKLGKVSA